MKKFLGFLFILGLVFCLPAFAQPDLQALDKIVEAQMKETRIPGLALSLSGPELGQVDRAYGFADLENRVKVGDNAVFCIGSVSKVFAALAVRKLEEEGKLKVTDPIVKYFPQYPDWGGTSPESPDFDKIYEPDQAYSKRNAITIRNLLQHTSGIPDLTDLEPIKSDQMKDFTPRQILEIVGSAPLDFAPGEKAQYSNSGAVLLALIVEKASGMSYAEYLKREILTPLNMKTTRLGSNLELIPHRVRGYHLEGNTMENALYASLIMPYASGGMMSSAPDLVKLERAFTPGVLLKKETVEAMFEPCRLRDGSIGMISPQASFGDCLELIKFDKNTFTPTKNGEISGFDSLYCRFQHPRFSLVLLSNRDGNSGALYKIAYEIQQLLIKEGIK